MNYLLIIPEIKLIGTYRTKRKLFETIYNVWKQKEHNSYSIYVGVQIAGDDDATFYQLLNEHEARDLTYSL